jgi:HTH-type transcriptional regulator / antitoxin HigA
MTETQRNEYRPDHVSAPGETLMDILEERGMSQAELAERTGRPLKTINEIIKGKTSLTPDTSIQLERVLGVAAEFWNQREAYYRAFLARSKEREDLDSYADWLLQFPVNEMIKRKWIPDPGKPKTSRIISILNYFGVANPDQWTEGWTQHRLAFRKSTTLTAKHGPTAVWLRQGEIEAEKIECEPYSREKLIAALPKIRKLTAEPNPTIFIPALQKLCAEAGVALVFVMPFVGVPIFGAAKWLNSNKAMIQLSARGKTDDLLWFTIFHELNHILHHSKKEMFVEFNTKEEARSPEEDEADQLASEQLLPALDFDRWISGKIAIGADDVIAFAKAQQIAPGIIVGRLQHKKLIHYSSPLSKLKVRYKWNE